MIERIERRKRGITVQKVVLTISIMTIVITTVLYILFARQYSRRTEVKTEGTFPSTSPTTICEQVRVIETQAYQLSRDLVETTQTEEEVFSYTEDELFCMAAAIYNEAGSDSCSDETRRLVGYVILNRVKDTRFPVSIREVLEAKRQYGNFYLTGIEFSDRANLAEEAAAVDRAYKIAKEVLLCDEIPIPSNVVFQAEFVQGTGIYKYQDGIYFCYAEEVK